MHALKKNRRITSFDIIIFLRQLATLIAAGIPIIKSFEILENGQVKTTLRLLIFTIKREILSGKDLFSSICQHSRYFDNMTCQLIKIGENTGKLDIILGQIAEAKEKNSILKKRAQQALIYPLFIIITAILVTFSMLYFVIPQFIELFETSKIQLPMLTRLIFYCSSVLHHYIFIIFLPLIMIPLIMNNKMKRNLKHLILKLPIIHSIVLKITFAKFARNLAMTFSAGMTIPDSLVLLVHVNQPQEFIHATLKLRHHITSGLQLHQAMSALPLFPDLMIQMVRIGEESGSLEHLLNKIACFFEADIENIINQLNLLLEPLIMLVLGVLIGGLVIGMYLPIFKLGNTL